MKEVMEMVLSLKTQFSCDRSSVLGPGPMDIESSFQEPE